MLSRKRRIFSRSHQISGPQTSSNLEKAGVPESPSSFQTEIAAIRVKELCHWGAMVSALMILHFSSDVSQHQFRSVPHLSEWSVVVLLLSAWVAVATTCLFPRMRQYAAYILAVGSLLTTCQLAWHWDSHVAHIKDAIRVDSPLAHAASLCNATAATATARHPTTRSLCTSIYGLILGASGLDFLDSGVFFIVLFQNCLQSSFLCRLGLRITAAVSLLQWAFFMVWPFIFVDLNPVWMCRIIGPGLWAAQQIRASYVWECELKQQAQRIDDLQWTLAKTRLQYLLLQQDKNQVG